MALLFEEGHKKEILLVMQGADRNLKIKSKLASTVRKKGTSSLNVISCRIRIRELLQIKRENNQKNPMKPVLQKVRIMMENSLLFLMATPNLVRIGFLIQVVCFMCPNRDWFSTYEIVFKGVVLMGNNASCKIASNGIVRIKIFDRVVKTLGNVRHVPDLKRNLILLSTLDSKGYKYTGESGVLKVSKGVLVVMKGRKGLLVGIRNYK